MKIKQAEIARELGLSKATVSLALAGKAGVNEETRKRVLEMQQLLQERYRAEEKRREQSIAILVLNHHKELFLDPMLDLLTPVLEAIEKGCTDMGYGMKTLYLFDYENDQKSLIRQCNAQDIAGVIVMGTEMEETDHWICEQIHVPMILWDYDIPELFLNSVCIDNGAAVEMACRLLWDAGCRDIVYLALDADIYNFSRRREGFHDAMLRRGVDVNMNDIIRTGRSVAEITKAVQNYLSSSRMPDAFIMENFEVSIGTIRALKNRRIHIPEDIRLVGIDIVPEGSTGDVLLSQIGIQHAERARLAMHLLEEVIASGNKSRGRLLGIPFIVEGNST